MTELIKTDENKINKYHSGKIYKIVNDIDDKVYIGSTYSPLYKRLYEHKSYCKKEKYNGLIYKHYRNLGVENMKIILVEEYKCENRMQLEKKEREYVDQYKGENSLNKNIPARDKKEWDRNYRNTNKDKIQKWFDDNIDKILEKRKKQRYKCVCGSEIRKDKKNAHEKTTKHIKYINSLNKDL